jgi:16S rRNA (guanine(966)-N(2))-methyltransferase RsmD
MRIISGTHKGKRLTAPKNLPVRPTTDMAKESLFNILNNSYDLREISVLDLFAGTGNISYEFASRGALDVVSVDRDHRCIKFIHSTAKGLQLKIQAHKRDVFKFLSRTSLKFDIVFADPPYDLTLEAFAKIPELVFENNVLLENGTLIVEHSKRMDLSHLTHFTNQRKYGGSVFSFFSK